MELTELEIKSNNLDTEEVKFINKKISNLQEGPADFQKRIIFEILELFQHCIDKHPDKIKEICTSDDTGSLLTDFSVRSRFYNDLYAYWDNKLAQKESPEIFNLVTAVHNFYPIFVEEIEGPLKKLLQVIDFLLRIDDKKELDWKAFQLTIKGEGKYITDVINSIEHSCKKTNYIKDIISGLNPSDSDIKLRLLRNAGAHSDYRVFTEDNFIKVEIKDIKISVMDFLTIFSMTNDLILIFNMCVYLGCGRLRKKIT